MDTKIYFNGKEEVAVVSFSISQSLCDVRANATSSSREISRPLALLFFVSFEEVKTDLRQRGGGFETPLHKDTRLFRVIPRTFCQLLQVLCEYLKTHHGFVAAQILGTITVMELCDS